MKLHNNEFKSHLNGPKVIKYLHCTISIMTSKYSFLSTLVFFFDKSREESIIGMAVLVHRNY